MLSVIAPSVIMLNFIMVDDVMLSVVGPYCWPPCDTGNTNLGEGSVHMTSSLR